MNEKSQAFQPDEADRDGPGVEYRVATDDDDILMSLGKAPVLQRNFDFWSILAFSLLVLSTYLSAFGILGVGLLNGGPAGIIYQWIIVWAGSLATFTTLAELASMAPTASGQYHWVSILAPRSCQKLLSYITGWFTVCGWQATTAAASYVAGLLIQGFIEVVYPAYVPAMWQATLLMYAVLFVAVLTNTVVGRYLPMIEKGLLVVYVLGFFGILISLVVVGPHARASEVFTRFINDGGWSNMGLSFMVGISGNAFGFLGADGVYHMSEEIQQAATTVPKAMVYGIILNGVVGLSMFIDILFTAGDLQAALQSDYAYPSIEILLQALKSRGGTAGVMVVLIVINLALVVGVVAAASRMLWSFARDRGIPLWRFVSKVGPRSHLPLRAVLISITISLLLGLISIGSPTAFNDVISLTVVSLYASYFMTILFATKAPITRDSTFRLIVVFIFSMFPPVTPVTPATMNYACLVLGFVMIMSVLYYYAIARRVYTGPVVDERLHR